MDVSLERKVTALEEPIIMNVCENTVQDDVPGMVVKCTMDAIGVEVPAIPGDVALCGKLRPEEVALLAPRYKAWLSINAVDDPSFHREEIEKSGIEIMVCHFPYISSVPIVPTEAQKDAVLEALDRLPRPLMIQCNTGMRAGVALTLWQAIRRGASASAVEQLAVDANLKFWTRCEKCGPMREWLMKQLPNNDKLESRRPAEGLLFQQLFDTETCTLTYLLGCLSSREAILIDPVLEQQERDLMTLAEMGLSLKYVINTHCHADHVTSGGAIRKMMPDVKTIIAKASGAKADIHSEEGDRIQFGSFALEVIGTPGHTDGCQTLYLPGSANTPGMAFTGDTLLIRGCGRTDFQQGSSEMLYEMVHKKIFTLPDDTLIYPGHDYKGRNVSTVSEEKLFNPRLTKTKDEFAKLMSELGLPYPKRIDVAVPANMVCGVQD